MKERIHIKHLYAGTMSLLLVFFITFSLDFPIQVDEILHYPHAQRVVEWYASGGEQDACFYHSDGDLERFGPSVVNLKHYGQSVDNLTALLNHWFNVEDEYRLRHIVGAVFAFLLILFSSLVAKELAGDYRAAFFTLSILLLVPAVMGQYCNNLKDIPFAAGYAMSLWAMVRVLKKLPRVPWKDILLLAVAIAFTNSVRIGGLVLLAYLAVFSYMGLLRYKGRSDVVRLLAQGFAIVMIAYFGGLLFWPYALIDPLKHPFESLSMMEHYSISIRQIFRGEWYWSTNLPDSYLPVWMLISLPLPVLAAFILYLITCFRRDRVLRTEEMLIAFALLFPLIYVVIIGSNLYSGWRQMYFLVVPLAVLSGLGVFRTLVTLKGKPILKAVVLLVLFGTSLPLAVHYMKRPHSSYAYFNPLAGGNKNAWSQYEYDYYWHGMKEAARQLDEMIFKHKAPGDEEVITIASNFHLPVYFPGRDDLRFIYVHFKERSKVEWDYGVFGINYIHPYRLTNDTWQPSAMESLITDGVNPLALLCTRSSTADKDALDLLHQGNYQEAAVLLQSVIEKDPNNLWLHENLLRCYYELDLEVECERLIGRCKVLHPEAEVPALYRAQLAFDRGKYGQAMDICLEILGYNSKFTAVVPLLIASSRKAGNDELADKLERKYPKEL